MRGIPVLYYGTELGLKGHENHGAIREDMPGFSEDFPDYSIIGGQLLNLCQELGAFRKTRGAVQFTKEYQRTVITSLRRPTTTPNGYWL